MIKGLFCSVIYENLALSCNADHLLIDLKRSPYGTHIVMSGNVKAVLVKNLEAELGLIFIIHRKFARIGLLITAFVGYSDLVSVNQGCSLVDLISAVSQRNAVIIVDVLVTVDGKLERSGRY